MQKHKNTKKFRRVPEFIWSNLESNVGNTKNTYLYSVKVINVKKLSNGTSKWWSLWTGGRYSEVVDSSGLTVLP
jgi:hypothetical protein